LFWKNWYWKRLKQILGPQACWTIDFSKSYVDIILFETIMRHKMCTSLKCTNVWACNKWKLSRFLLGNSHWDKDYFSFKFSWMLANLHTIISAFVHNVQNSTAAHRAYFFWKQNISSTYRGRRNCLNIYEVCSCFCIV
jgi:hypothetical protein